jgi:hypothetical protein
MNKLTESPQQNNEAGIKIKINNLQFEDSEVQIRKASPRLKKPLIIIEPMGNERIS